MNALSRLFVWGVLVLFLPGNSNASAPIIVITSCRLVNGDMVLSVSVEAAKPVLLNLKPPVVSPLHHYFLSVLFGRALEGLTYENVLIFSLEEEHTRFRGSGDPRPYLNWMWEAGPDSALLGSGSRFVFDVVVEQVILEELRGVLGSDPRFVRIALGAQRREAVPKKIVFFRHISPLDPQPRHVSIPALRDPFREEGRKRRQYVPFGINDYFSYSLPFELVCQ